ncbi:MAG: hypothetical protein M1491_04615 [Deltaproteobacteria bacterium]|nr:hypothetical protein [Deltaproteobacteria bacterium]MCL5276179.1 hypothetical protein [Deltaproteobacteria bacterium]
MKITGIIKEGRRIIYGSGTYEEIESLNAEKDFNGVLDRVYDIKKTVMHLFNIPGPMKVDRKVYGKRKAIRR